MKKKGILLCGGAGKRFRPTTYAVNKHLFDLVFQTHLKRPLQGLNKK